MSNSEHLALLLRGADVWNEWRRWANVYPDLRRANLQRSRFVGVNFTLTQFDETDLRWCTFEHCWFDKAQGLRTALSDAQLIDCSFSECTFGHGDWQRIKIDRTLWVNTSLEEIDFTSSKLHNSDFVACRIERCSLRKASLSYVRFQQDTLTDLEIASATVSQLVFASTPLQGVHGLADVAYVGSSSISLDSLIQSGALPHDFLQATGVPQMLIEYNESAQRLPVDFNSCFISYSTRDDAFAARLHADLTSRGVRTWFAPHELKTGDRIRDKIEESIRVHDKVLLVLSVNSIGSDWVASESEAALERERREKRDILFPITLDDAVFATDTAWAAEIRRTRLVGDFKRWGDADTYRFSFEKLLRDLRRTPSVARRY